MEWAECKASRTILCIKTSKLNSFSGSTSTISSARLQATVSTRHRMVVSTATTRPQPFNRPLPKDQSALCLETAVADLIGFTIRSNECFTDSVRILRLRCKTKRVGGSKRTGTTDGAGACHLNAHKLCFQIRSTSRCVCGSWHSCSSIARRKDRP